MPTLSELSSLMLLFIIIWDLWLISQKCKELEQVQIVNLGNVPKKKKEQEEPQVDLRFYRLKNFEKKKQKFLQSMQPYEVIPQPEYQVRVKKAEPIKPRRPLTYTELQPEIEKKVKVQDTQLPVMELVKQPITKPQIVEVPKLELKITDEKVNLKEIEFFQPQVQKVNQDVPLFKPTSTPVVPIMSSIFGNSPMLPTPQPPVLFGGNTTQAKQDDAVVEVPKVSIFGNDNDLQQSFEVKNEPPKVKEQSPKNIFNQPDLEDIKNIPEIGSMPAPQTQMSFSNLQTEQPKLDVQPVVSQTPPQQQQTSIFSNLMPAQPSTTQPAQVQNVQQTPLFGNQSLKKPSSGLFTQFGIKTPTNSQSQQPEQKNSVFSLLNQQIPLATNQQISIGQKPAGQGILFGMLQDNNYTQNSPLTTQQPLTTQASQGTSLFGNLAQGITQAAQGQQPQSAVFGTSVPQNPQQPQIPSSFGTLQNPQTQTPPLNLQASLFNSKPGGLFG